VAAHACHRLERLHSGGGISLLERELSASGHEPSQLTLVREMRQPHADSGAALEAPVALRKAGRIAQRIEGRSRALEHLRSARAPLRAVSAWESRIPHLVLDEEPVRVRERAPLRGAYRVDAERAHRLQVDRSGVGVGIGRHQRWSRRRLSLWLLLVRGSRHRTVRDGDPTHDDAKCCTKTEHPRSVRRAPPANARHCA